MTKFAHCTACRFLAQGVKTRISIPHTCGRSNEQIKEYVKEHKLKFVKEMEKIASTTNSPIGSSHWFHTLVGRVKMIGEYLKSKDAPSQEVREEWGKSLYSAAEELMSGFKDINSEYSTRRYMTPAGSVVGSADYEQFSEDYRNRCVPFMSQAEADRITHFHVADNSNAFREWLDFRKIEWKANGHFTSISIDHDIFALGSSFGVYKYRHTKGGLFDTEQVITFMTEFGRSVEKNPIDEIDKTYARGWLETYQLQTPQ